MRIVMLVALGFCIQMPLEAFKTLTEAEAFAKAFGENEKMSWDIREFKEVLTTVLNQRENVGYTGRYVVKLTPYPGSQFVIWGPVKGAFKSLVRTLTYLKEKQILKDDFTIWTHDTYFVFLGDVLNGTEHLLETFMVVLSLMKANPSRVIYLRGHREDYLHWQNNGLKKVLKTKGRSISEEKIPLGRSITHFFDTLPLALYLSGEDPRDGLVRLSYFGGDTKELEERNCPTLTRSRAVNVPELCPLSIIQRAPLRVKAILKAEDRVISYKFYTGLTLNEPDRGATAWTAFSSPTTSYQKDYQFYYDAFSILTTAAKLSDFHITLYNRDMRGLDPFAKAGTYMLITGQKIIEEKSKAPTPSNQALSAQIDQLQKKIKTLAQKVVNVRQILDALPVQGEKV